MNSSTPSIIVQKKNNNQQEVNSLISLINQAEATCKLYDEKNDSSSFERLKQSINKNPGDFKQLKKEVGSLLEQVASTTIKKKVVSAIAYVINSQSEVSGTMSKELAEQKLEQSIDDFNKLEKEVTQISTAKKSTGMLSYLLGSSTSDVQFSKELITEYMKLIRMAKEEVILRSHQQQKIIYSADEYEKLNQMFREKELLAQEFQKQVKKLQDQNTQLQLQLDQNQKSQKQQLEEILQQHKSQVDKLQSTLEAKESESSVLTKTHNDLKDKYVVLTQDNATIKQEMNKQLRITSQEFFSLKTDNVIDKVINYCIADLELEHLHAKLNDMLSKAKFPYRAFNNKELIEQIKKTYSAVSHFYRNKIFINHNTSEKDEKTSEIKSSEPSKEITGIENLRTQALTRCGLSILVNMEYVSSAQLFKPRVFSHSETPHSLNDKHPLRFKKNEEDEKLINTYFDEINKRSNPSIKECEEMAALLKKSENLITRNTDAIKLSAQIRFDQQQEQKRLGSIVQQHSVSNTFNRLKVSK